MQRRNTWQTYALIALAALLPVLPYLWFGYAGHDIELHVTSWIEVAEAWRGGMLYPGWSERANFMLGDPHFCFYPPLSFVLGGALATALPIHLVPGAFMWVAIALAGLSMHAASAGFVEGRFRLPAALLYMLSPYLVTTSLVRFAAAELLVQSVLPFILLAFWRGVWLREHRWMAALGGLLAIAWLTNIPAAIVIFYALLPAVAVSAWQRRSLGPALYFAAAELLSLSLAAFHLVPVLVERGWISQGRLVRQDPRVLLMFFARHDASLHAMRTFVFGLWLIALGMASVGALCLVGRSEPLSRDPRARLLLTIAATALFFQTPLAAPLWQAMPQLSSAAFPYRFLPLEAAPVILLLFSEATSRRWRRPAIVALALLTLLPLAEVAIVQSKPDTRMPSFADTLTRWNTKGYDGFPEFVPADAQVDVRESAEVQGCVVRASSSLTVQPYVETSSAGPCTMTLHRLAYPYWQARLDGNTNLPLTQSPEGRIQAVIPAGAHRLELAFVPRSPARIVAGLVSLVTALMLAAFGWRTRWQFKRAY